MSCYPRIPLDPTVITEQHHKNDCDPSFLIKRAIRTGQRLDLQQRGYFADCSDIPTPEVVRATLNKAHEAVRLLPKTLRDQIKSPSHAMTVLEHPANRAILEQVGLLKPIPAPPPVPVPKTAPTEPPQGSAEPSAGGGT